MEPLADRAHFFAGSGFASSALAVSSLRSLLVAIVLVIPAAASAETNSASAHSLFVEARAAMDRGAYDEACPKLEESMRLDAAVGTQLNLAECWERVGKIASAWAGFLDAASMAKTSRQPEREKLARARAKSLEPRVPKLVIEADLSSEPGLEILRDGVAVGSASWATPVAIDPGSHDIVATAPGKMSWRTVVEAKEGQTTRVAVPKKLFVRVERRIAVR
jgi:hypothetical protein